MILAPPTWEEGLRSNNTVSVPPGDWKELYTNKRSLATSVPHSLSLGAKALVSLSIWWDSFKEKGQSGNSVLASKAKTFKSMNSLIGRIWLLWMAAFELGNEHLNLNILSFFSLLTVFSIFKSIAKEIICYQDRSFWMWNCMTSILQTCPLFRLWSRALNVSSFCLPSFLVLNFII